MNKTILTRRANIMTSPQWNKTSLGLEEHSSGQ